MLICQQNLLHAQKLPKEAYNKGVKPCNYAQDKKLWFNCKYIKIKQNQNLEIKFFEPFQVFHPMSNLAYKFDLPTKRKIYNIFYISLLKQNQQKMGESTSFWNESSMQGKDKQYKFEIIKDSNSYHGYKRLIIRVILFSILKRLPRE